MAHLHTITLGLYVPGATANTQLGVVLHTACQYNVQVVAWAATCPLEGNNASVTLTGRQSDLLSMALDLGHEDVRCSSTITTPEVTVWARTQPVSN